jgi:hypothetical protein
MDMKLYEKGLHTHQNSFICLNNIFNCHVNIMQGLVVVSFMASSSKTMKDDDISQ